MAFRLFLFIFSIGASVGLGGEKLGESGKLNRLVWLGFAPKDSLYAARRQERFNLPPLESSEVSMTSIPAQEGKGFLQILRGYLLVPKTGYYHFWMAGNHDTTFMLGATDDKFSKTALLNIGKSSRFQGWGDHRENASQAVFLKEGEVRYLEIQNKARFEPGHVSLAWSYSDEELQNWALEPGAVASQTSVAVADSVLLEANLAIDGFTEGYFRGHRFAKTSVETNPSWQVDLGQPRLIDRIEVYNRQRANHSFSEGLENYRVSILDSSKKVVITREFHTRKGHTRAFEIWEPRGLVGSYVKIELLGDEPRALNLAEVKVLGRSDSLQVFQGVELLPSKVLRSYAGSSRDLDEDGLPDLWQKKNRLPKSKSVAMQMGYDRDKDGFAVFEEAVFGTKDNSPSSIRGYLSGEIWLKPTERSFEEFIHSHRFLAGPNWLRNRRSSQSYFANSICGQRIRGYLVPEKSGDYHFHLSAVGSSEFWLSEDESKVAKRRLVKISPDLGHQSGMWKIAPDGWTRHAAQRSQVKSLKAGQQYFFEIINFTLADAFPHISLAWTHQDASIPEPIPPSQFQSYARSKSDSDDDTLPDHWELKYDLDPTSNLGDDGEYGDPDHDGLINREECLYGTNPRKPDSDGDQRSDTDEIRGYLTNPNSPDPPLGPRAFSIDVLKILKSGGGWRVENQAMVPELFRDEISWNLLPKPKEEGRYLIQIRTELRGTLHPHEEVEVEVQIDDYPAVRKTLVFGPDHKALLSVTSPYLLAEKHRLTLKVDNFLSRRFLCVADIEIYHADDQDGLAASLLKQNSLIAAPASSPTSPAYFEGTARTGIAGMTFEDDASVFTATSPEHWYAGLILSSGEPTPYRIQFEPGILPIEGSVIWTETNILKEKSPMIIRQGESVKLVARSSKRAKNFTSTITVPSGQNWASSLNGATAKQFPHQIGRGGGAHLAIDGNRDPLWTNRSVSQTLPYAKGKVWWEVDLQTERQVGRVVVWNCADTNIRCSNYRIKIFDNKGKLTASQAIQLVKPQTEGEEKKVWELRDKDGRPMLVRGRRVRIERVGPSADGKNILSFAEVEIFGNNALRSAKNENSIVYSFAEAGRFLVSATPADGKMRTLEVIVKKAQLPEDAQDLLIDSDGLLHFQDKDIDAQLFLEAGEHISIGPRSSVKEGNFSVPVRVNDSGPAQLVARLWENGPIVGTQKLNLIQLTAPFQNPSRPGVTSEHFEGYQIHSTPLVATNFPVGAKIEVFIKEEPDVLRRSFFPDGQPTRALTSLDFQQDIAYLDFLLPASMKIPRQFKIKLYGRDGRVLGSR